MSDRWSKKIAVEHLEEMKDPFATEKPKEGLIPKLGDIVRNMAGKNKGQPK